MGVCACMCVLDGEGSMMVAIASTVLVVIWMTVCLTGYSDHLTGLCEPLSPPYRCHTVLKGQHDHWQYPTTGLQNTHNSETQYSAVKTYQFLYEH